MARLKHQMHDPFRGKLYEGLPYSIAIDIAIQTIRDAKFEIYDVSSIKDSFIVKLMPRYPSYRLQKYTTGYIYDISISQLLELANWLGYDPVDIQLPVSRWNGIFYSIKYSGPKFRDIIYGEEPNSIWITFDKKFDNIQISM